MLKRALVTLALVAAFGAGAWFAFDATRPEAYVDGTHLYALLFDDMAWMVWLAPFLGLLVSGYTTRTESRIVRGRVLRHDGPAILEHWTHAAGTVLLIVTGAMLGSLWSPRLATSLGEVRVAMNLHFTGVVPFLFGSFYYAGNAWHTRRFGDHLPWPLTQAVAGAFRHYRATLLRTAKPAEGKYFDSERLSFPFMVVACVGVVVSGFGKMLAHELPFSTAVRDGLDLVHDGSAVAVLVFLVAHIILGAVVPWSWPLLWSILSGTVSERYAREHHARWYEEILAAQPAEEPAGEVGMAESPREVDAVEVAGEVESAEPVVGDEAEPVIDPESAEDPVPDAQPGMRVTNDHGASEDVDGD